MTKKKYCKLKSEHQIVNWLKFTRKTQTSKDFVIGISGGSILPSLLRQARKTDGRYLRKMPIHQHESHVSCGWNISNN
jgi:hypothetical protein